MKVKNLNGTSDNNCKCGSWVNHWKRFSGQQLRECVVLGCNNRASVGAHVKKDEILSTGDWFIIPICQECNQKRGQSLNIYDDVVLVSANRKETCERLF